MLRVLGYFIGACLLLIAAYKVIELVSNVLRPFSAEAREAKRLAALDAAEDGRDPALAERLRREMREL